MAKRWKNSLMRGVGTRGSLGTVESWRKLACLRGVTPAARHAARQVPKYIWAHLRRYG